jgi:hypothetical protein
MRKKFRVYAIVPMEGKFEDQALTWAKRMLRIAKHGG